MKSMLRLACSITLCVFTADGFADRALFYETFEEYDVRNEGVILPEGVERSRFGGRIAETEMEIEAPVGPDGEPTARWIEDPTGLSLTCLMALDRDDVADSFILGSDGAVTLFESILLDQGDNAGRAVISWMAVPFQTNEPGGTLFPETDSRVDPGPEGLNLIGFGGVSRDFDTGEPIPGADFSGQITLNRGESAEIIDLGVGYEANLPTFFTLIFDLEESVYDIYINGLLVKEDNPFFDVQGRVGRTLRELEWISSPRGFGDFAYDNLFQFDPDQPYSPVEFRAPFHAEDSPLVSLFIEEFDDNALGTLSENLTGDLPGTQIITRGDVEVVEDDSFRSLSQLRLSQSSEFIAQYSPSTDGDPIRYSFNITPETGSLTSIRLANGSAIDIESGSVLAVDMNGDGQTEATAIEVIATLPHWFVVEVDPNSGEMELSMYRATSAEDAQTVRFTALGQLNGDVKNSIEVISVSGSAHIDNLLITEINHTANGSDTVAYEIVNRMDFETNEAGAVDGDPSLTVVEDPSGWSLQSLLAQGAHTIELTNEPGIAREVLISWSVIPNSIHHSSELVLETETQERFSIVSLLQDGNAGVFDNNQFISTGASYEIGFRNDFSVSIDLLNGSFTVSLNQKQVHSGLLGENVPASVASFELTGNDNSDVYYDDIIVINNPRSSSFTPSELAELPSLDSATLLFAENFEDKPARSDQIVNEFDPRRSGAPIPTRSNGTTVVEGAIVGTKALVGAPSAGAVYVENETSGNGYSLLLQDSFAPIDYSQFASALPFTPISTFRTIPYSVYAPVLTSNPTGRFVTMKWSAAAMQTDQIGLVLFPSTQATEIVVPSNSISTEAPAGEPLFAFGDDGTLWAKFDSGLLSTGVNYSITRSYRFVLSLDQVTSTYDLWMDGKQVIDNGPAPDQLEQTFGWFSTLVNSGDGTELQQSTSGGGTFVIDNVLVIESEDETDIYDFLLY